MSGTDAGTSLDREGLPAAVTGGGTSMRQRQETSLRPSFSYFTVTFNYPNEVSSAIATENINPGQP